MKLLFEIPQELTGAGHTHFAWQSGLGNFLAVAGINNVVTIFDRQGQSVATIPLPGRCTSLSWDKEGEHLAITQDFNGLLYMWNSNNYEIMKFETGVKEGLSLALWAKHSRLLAIGTIRGNLVLYNHRTKRKIPVLGKHTKKITSGAWSDQNVLALTGEDKKVTISDQDGNTISQKEVKFELRDLKFSPDGQMLSAVCGVKVLYLFSIDGGSNPPLELVFEPKYGNITAQAWYENDNILLGFSKGFMVMISRKKEEIGRELFQSHNHKGCLNDIAISPSAPLLATSSNQQIKLHEFNDLRGMYGMFQIEDMKGSLAKLQWTDDSQLLSASLQNGGLMTFLVQLPQLGDIYETNISYLSSLLQVTIVKKDLEEPPLIVDCPIEPSFIAIGLTHLAIGMNNRLWFTDFTQNKSFSERSYVGTITDVKLNREFVAALTNGTIELHRIASSSVIWLGETPQANEHEGRTFPDEGQNDNISCLALTSNFLIYGTEDGSITYFYLEDWHFVNEFKHVVGISQLFPDYTGTKLVFIDDKSDTFLYNPVTDALLEISGVTPSVTGFLWESYPDDKYIFVAYDKDQMTTYIYYQDTYEGPCCVSAETTTILPYGNRPLHLYQGDVSCLTLTGKLNSVRLSSHCFSDNQDLSESELMSSFRKSLVLKKLKDAWNFALALDKIECWQELGSTALHHFDVKLAIRAYQQIRDVAMVYSLKQIESIEDRNLLAGYIFLYFKEYNRAQEIFLASSKPSAALEMRCDLLQWDQALELAKTLSPSSIPQLSKQYAQQLEFIGDYGNALINYERGITNLPEDAVHDTQCNAGLARTSLYTGDIRRGVKLAQSSSDKHLKKECASILNGLKLFAESGLLYEQSECWEEATTAFIRIKNWEKVSQLLPRLSKATKLYSQYAKARETDGYYQEAATAYEKAKEYDSAIRVYLQCLKLPDEAVRVVNESQSIEGAKMVARFFQGVGDYASALQFLVVSKCNDDAYKMAESHGQMDQYAEVIGENGTTDDYRRVALYYERTNNYFKAGVFFLKCLDYKKALHHFLTCPIALFPDGENIDMAIKVVGQARLESLTHHLYNYLMGEVDGEPKEAKFLFGMYMALKQYSEAAQTAILIAREDQSAGNYRSARDMLYQMYKDLREENIKIPSEMNQSLMLLHSYLLVKIHVKMSAHDKAARLLVRVANNISKFPSHIVPILTSTVIECQRSGLKESAFGYAAMLMRPEYRSHIDNKWKKKLESIVRKPERSEVEDPLEPCPVCSFMLSQMRLDCPQCKTNLPYCIVTGRHMIAEDWCECPSCHFPALYSEFKLVLESEGCCPLCAVTLSHDQLQLVTDIQSRLKTYTNEN